MQTVNKPGVVRAAMRRDPKPGGDADQDPAGQKRKLLERELYEIWMGQRFPAGALGLPDGSLLRVVYRGRPGRGAGPDFRDAIIARGDGALLKGDVELHVRASDFRRHGHGADPAYDRVALHVVFYHDGGATIASSGRELLTVALAPWVATRAGELQRWLEQPPLWQEPCHDAVARLGGEEVGARLRRLGIRRLRQKAAALRKRVLAQGFEDAVYRELLEAVGFGPNRHVFRALAAATSWHEVLPAPASVLSTALAAEGLIFERPTRPGAGGDQRLAGAAALIARLGRFGNGSLAGALEVVLGEAEDGAALVLALEVEGDGPKGGQMIGRGRAAEIAVNVILPAALVMGHEKRALALYESAPDPGSYGLTAYLEGILRRQDPAVLRGAAERQGLLLMQKEYCTQGGCGSCPLSPPVDPAGRPFGRGGAAHPAPLA
ncbi:MAG: DUF2851 family protein [Dehalococcoidia bacterium]